MSGIIWTGIDEFVPVMEEDQGKWVRIFNDLKNIPLEEVNTAGNDDWEFTVPKAGRERSERSAYQ